MRVTEAQWRQKFTLLTQSPEGEPLLQALFEAAGNSQAQEVVVKGAKHRLDEGARLIDLAPEEDRQALRRELLGLINDERGHARAYGVAVQSFVLALLACLAAQYEKVKAAQTTLEASLKVYEGRVTELDQEAYALKTLSRRAGSAVEAQLQFLVDDVEAKARPTRAKVEKTRRRLDQLRGEAKGLADQVATYQAAGKPASIGQPKSWPLVARARAKQMVAQNCLVS